MKKQLEAARQHVIDKGATPTADDYILETKFGKLFISFDEDTIFTRFDEPQRAVHAIGARNMNPHNGKWNHHWTHNTADAGLDYFKAMINMLTRQP